MAKMTNRKKQALSTRKKIYDIATGLFTKKSYEKVTIEEICREAGISIGAFYHHFANKESILNEGYFWFDEDLRVEWVKRGHLSVKGDISFLIQSQLEAISEGGFIYASQFFKNQLSNQTKYILDENRFFYECFIETVQRGVEEGLFKTASAEEITQVLLRVSRGTIYDWCLHEGSYALIENGLKDMDIVLHYYS